MGEMCGISGIVNGDVQPMISSQVHRGPDHSGKSIYRNVAFGHNRLSILDLSEAGNQPMENERWLLTYNGEIYNYQELEGKGNDAARIIPTVEKYGITGALSRMNGMFAFGLYDKVESKIHLIVDRFAQKPLYYFQSGDVFAFASSPAALLHLKDKWEIDKEALKTYWLLGSVMYASIWKGIKKANGSEWITYDLRTKKASHRIYWTPKYTPQDPTDLILDAISKMKVSDVPVYLFLSGGIDSSVAASQFSNAIHMDGPEKDYAREAAQKFGLNLKIVSPKTFGAAEALTDYSLKSGEPTMAGIIPWIVAKEASQFCKVAISANGADELFFGYDRTSQKVTDKQLKHIFRDLNYDIPEINSIDERLSSGRWLELKTYIECDLNKTLDFASMCHSLEVRSPFLDHRLVEVALSLEECGRKEHLKNILRRFKFSEQFINRPKRGFTLYQQPVGYVALQDSAFHWCVKEGFIPKKDYSPRDLMYLKASAAGFKIWFETWKSLITNMG